MRMWTQQRARGKLDVTVAKITGDVWGSLTWSRATQNMKQCRRHDVLKINAILYVLIWLPSLMIWIYLSKWSRNPPAWRSAARQRARRTPALSPQQITTTELHNASCEMCDNINLTGSLHVMLWGTGHTAWYQVWCMSVRWRPGS